MAVFAASLEVRCKLEPLEKVLKFHHASAVDALAQTSFPVLQLLLLPGAVSAATSSATGSGLSVGYVGQTASFTVTARDAAGNVVSKVPSISFVPKNAADPTSLQIALTGCANDGTNCQAVVTYVPVQYGTIKVVVSYGATGEYL